MPVFIDPTSGTNGAGTYADPRNTWSGVTWTAGETYLQKEGTTFASQIAVGADGDAGDPIIVGTYDATTGAQLFDPSRRAYLRPSTGHGVWIAGYSNVRVDNLDIEAAADAGTNHGVASSATTPDAARNLEVVRCKVHGLDAITVRGAGTYIALNEVYGKRDGIVFDGSTGTVEDNLVRGDRGDTATWDGITHLSTATATTNVHIRRNRVVDSLGTEKQGVYAVSTTAGAIYIYDNEIEGFYQGILVFTPNTRVFNNDVVGSGTKYNAGDSRCVTISGADCRVLCNYLADTPGRAVSMGAVSGVVVENNTALRVGTGWVWNTGTVTGTLRNNVAVRASNSTGYLLDRVSTATITRAGNCYFDDGRGTLIRDGGNVRATFAAYQAVANETGAFGDDPQINEDGRPLPGSPLLTGGNNLGPRRDRRGVMGRGYIGAYAPVVNRVWR